MVAAKLFDVSSAGRPRIDRYDLVAEIASGGMATVYLARLSGVGGFQRFVAIKRLHPHLANDEQFVQMFLDEARLAAGIHHPNVVPILEVGDAGVGYYLVMEYIEGDTLARLLARAATRDRPLPAHIGLRIVVDTLAGLHAAHELRDELGGLTGLVHRDVSPQNILVGVDGVSRITDFGVARAASRLSATRSGQLKGKIAYMAPEQAAGESVDRRADVFAAGIVLWEVLASRRLFKAANEAATLSRVLSGAIDDPRTHVPSLPARIAEVCMTALERNASKRFESCAQFADALERAAEEAPDAAVASPKECAEYVSEVIGNEIAQQRDAVRGWLARSELSQSRGILDGEPTQPADEQTALDGHASVVERRRARHGSGAAWIANTQVRRRLPLYVAPPLVALLLGGTFYLGVASGRNDTPEEELFAAPEPARSAAPEGPGSPAPVSPPVPTSLEPPVASTPVRPSASASSRPRRSPADALDLRNPYVRSDSVAVPRGTRPDRQGP